MKRFALAAAMFTAACGGYSEDQFEADAPAVLCGFFVECLQSHDDVAACLADPDFDSSTNDDCVNYDAVAAEACLAGVEALTDACPTTMDENTFPASCETICDTDTDTGMDTDTSAE